MGYGTNLVLISLNPVIFTRTVKWYNNKLFDFFNVKAKASNVNVKYNSRQSDSAAGSD